jgi:hypothetical protein
MRPPPIGETDMRNRYSSRAWLPCLALAALALAAAGGCSLFGGDEDDDSPSTPTTPPPVPVALDVKWSVKVDASGAQLLAFKARIEAASAQLWNATSGQMYVRNVQLVDQDETGNVILDNLNQQEATTYFAYTYQISGGGWEIHMGGLYPMQAWIHEVGHAEVLQDWTVSEEYDLPGSTCPLCAMEAYVTGTGDGKMIYCDSGNCTKSQRNGCWQALILQMHSNWTYPRTAGAAPACTVTITDNP